jgi:hypothetical protein
MDVGPRASSDEARQPVEDGAARPDPPPFFKHVVASPHSVLTANLIDAEGEPTTQARDEVLAFLRMRLFGEASFQAETII